ncbi:MAG: hypothetical protein AB7L84_02315, partial [Acidimicrobiia bacterium]
MTAPTDDAGPGTVPPANADRLARLLGGDVELPAHGTGVRAARRAGAGLDADTDGDPDPGSGRTRHAEPPRRTAWQ